MANPQMAGGASGRNLAVTPQKIQLFVFFRFFQWLSAKLYAPSPGGGNALCLALTDEFSLRLRHIGNQLQYNIGNQGSDPVVSLSMSKLPKPGPVLFSLHLPFSGVS